MDVSATIDLACATARWGVLAGARCFGAGALFTDRLGSVIGREQQP